MVGRSGSEATKHSAASLPPKNDKINKPKKLSADLFKGLVGAGGLFTKNSDEIRIMCRSTRPKTMGIGNDFMGGGSSFTNNLDEIRIMSKNPRPKTMGAGSESGGRPKTMGAGSESGGRPKTMGSGSESGGRPKTMGAGSESGGRPKTMGAGSHSPKTMGIGSDFMQHVARSKSPLYADQDALCRPSGQYIKQRQVGTGNAHKKSPNLESKGFGYGIPKLNLGTDGGTSKNLYLNITYGTENDVLRGQMGSIGEQHVDQSAVKAGSTQNKSSKKSKDKMRKSDLAEDTLNSGTAGARSKNLREKPNVLLATDQYAADKGKGKAPKKGKKKTANISFSSPHDQEVYEALQASVKALKEETHLLNEQMQAESKITAQIQEENIMLLDQLRLKCTPSEIEQLEAEDPSRRGS